MVCAISFQHGSYFLIAPLKSRSDHTVCTLRLHHGLKTSNRKYKLLFQTDTDFVRSINPDDETRVFSFYQGVF